MASRLTPPDRNTLVRDQLVIHGDFPLAAHHRLFEELTAQRADLCRRLALPCSDEPIHVYLFETPERFQGFMQAALSAVSRPPGVLCRDRRPAVGLRPVGRPHGRGLAARGHARLPARGRADVPLWLDEGIAKFYEVAAGPTGLEPPAAGSPAGANRAASTGSRTCGGWNSFRANYNMTQDDYAEAWAWVHWLMESRPE